MSCKIISPLELKFPLAARPSLKFLSRLISFYNRQPSTEDSISDIWKTARSLHHRSLHQALLSGQAGTVAALLGNVYDGCTMFGLDYGRNVLTDSGEEGINVYKSRWIDMIKRAAWSLGVIPVQNDEQAFNEDHELDQLFLAMEAVLCCPLTHPGGGGAFGIDVNGRFVPYKLLDAACIVGAIQRMYKAGPSLELVYELGAGSGMLACLLLRVFPSIAKYVTNDLPIVSVIQAYLLAQVFTEEKILLCGEEPTIRPARIFIMGQNVEVPSYIKPFDLAINQDSLPEMPHPIQDRYLLHIQDILANRAKFYSVNQESPRGNQMRVFCATQKLSQLTLIHRCPYWGRNGYVEEVWIKG
jgi:hypothetical protein